MHGAKSDVRFTSIPESGHVPMVRSALALNVDGCSAQANVCYGHHDCNDDIPPRHPGLALHYSFNFGDANCRARLRIEHP
jgi:hypothetical protein